MRKLLLLSLVLAATFFASSTAQAGGGVLVRTAPDKAICFRCESCPSGTRPSFLTCIGCIYIPCPN